MNEEWHEKVERNKPRKKIIFDNFIGGVAWGVGITMGIALLITVLAYIAHRYHYVPIIGDAAVALYKSATEKEDQK